MGSRTCKRVPVGLDEVRRSTGGTCLGANQHHHAKLRLRPASPEIYHKQQVTGTATYKNKNHMSKSLP